ncbi:hypothetical protein [uncultured Marinobacter sp.]|uniref:hypothetical protein n=1 Tax=uncultured Marinobacter sp. TaxID=187379 RepID=UPI0025DD43C6|nr:hypothetical protein [uncultured Marinobacter sp.]
MSMQTVTKQEFEEGLREDGTCQQRLHRHSVCVIEKDMHRMIGASVADCEATLDGLLRHYQADALRRITGVLQLMNERGVEKRSHRQAIARAARAVIKNLAEVPSDE